MSYEIMYDKKFIKIDGSYIPLVLAGSNNCWDGNKRERKWGLFFDFFSDDIIFKGESIIKLLNENLNNDLDYISINNKSSKDLVINYYKNGIKNALTIEEALDRYTSLFQVVIQYYDEKIEPYYERFVDIKREYVNSTEQLKDLISYYKEIKKSHNKKVYLTLRFSGNDKLKLNYKYKMLRKENQKNIIKEKNFVVLMKDYGFVIKMTSKSVQFTPYKNYAMTFEKEKEATKYIERLKNKIGDRYNFVIESYNS
jgi:hypothetical protein